MALSPGTQISPDRLARQTMGRYRLTKQPANGVFAGCMKAGESPRISS
ncbi:hypothetical protein BSS2_I1550 [Brucella suis bv. 1 str. S2]|uniref:Uncharacterized protein n=6 Tax=Brucella TaxID=234 RepID=Q57BS5_BRUAB|nr:hypothetical protein BR1597 [Brucella suis 1330]AAX74909.1 hypothetical protein BruAb1_1584 [Brucella abortus bv. 1 str. 9-941]ABX62653.1 Hypothetical protein, conserved [Brucella canis ATCC 23365]ABY38680.1 Hypothetical protein, conserved [Brucella suis ATCC 23445]ACO01349.1 Hypothetical protein, conserved [Brucella melitensis ATCC 23457]ACU48572.1 hypothetical protein BMI_I1610 [Brucella microti CCM 4915]ADZ66678.1 conserved hypothetical protein [Brucella melitensis M28]ADZ87531.1 conse